MYDTVVLSPKADMGSMHPKHLRSRATVFQQVNRLSPGGCVEDVEEYVRVVNSSFKLLEQVVEAAKLGPKRHHNITLSERFQCHVSSMYAILTKPVDAPKANTHTKYMHNIFVQSGLEYAEYCKHIKMYVTHQTGRYDQLYNRIHAAGAQGTATQSADEYKYSLVYNALEVCQLVVNFNFFDTAPYGAVTMGAMLLSLDVDMLRESHIFHVCVAYSMPQVYVSIDSECHNHKAYVSLANIDYVAGTRKQAFYNYAVYRQDDIQSAIFARFGDKTKITEMYLQRLRRLQTITVTLSKETTDTAFHSTEIQVFYTRGVFNARFVRLIFMRDAILRNALYELVDMYRNVQLMGVSTYNNHASVIFPRIIVRFSSVLEYNNRLAGAVNCTVLSVIHDLKQLINNIQSYIRSVQLNNPLLSQLYEDSMCQALQSRVSVARENVRLAFSMTHNGLHRYAKYMVDCYGESEPTLLQYVRAAILQCSHIDCTECRQTYYRCSDRYYYQFTHDRAQYSANIVDDTKIIDADISIFFGYLSSMHTRLYTTSYKLLNTYRYNNFKTLKTCILSDLYKLLIAKQRRIIDTTEQSVIFAGLEASSCAHKHDIDIVQNLHQFISTYTERLYTVSAISVHEISVFLLRRKRMELDKYAHKASMSIHKD